MATKMADLPAEQRVVGQNREWWDRTESGGTEQRVVGQNREWWDRTESGSSLFKVAKV